jgi:hypothetical protein
MYLLSTNFAEKMGLGQTLGDFIANSSGRPECELGCGKLPIAAVGTRKFFSAEKFSAEKFSAENFFRGRRNRRVITARVNRSGRPETDVMIVKIFSRKKMRKNWRF